MAESKPRPPKGLQARGRAFWRSATGTFDFDLSETELLTETARLIDQCEALHEVLERDGLTTTGSQGQVRAHPVIAELRASRLALSRLLSTLGLPDESGHTLASPERLRARTASGARWAQPRSGSRVSDMARHAADVRWKPPRGRGPGAA